MVSYDIKNDNLRSKIAKKLIYFGLSRIQYSVYLGEAHPKVGRQILAWLKKAVPLSKNENKWLYLPMTSEVFKKLSSDKNSGKVLKSELHLPPVLVL